MPAVTNTPRPVSPTPATALSVHEVVHDIPASNGATRTVEGMYFHSNSTLVDPDSVVYTTIPGYMTGTAELKVVNFPASLVAGLERDTSGNNLPERWGNVRLTGTVNVRDGVAQLTATSGEFYEPPALPQW